MTQRRPPMRIPTGSQPGVKGPKAAAPGKLGADVGDAVAGRYRLTARLGTGGMGQVFLARVEGPAGFHKEVALKVAHDHVSEDQSWVDSFLAEARVAANLTHANIAQIYDLGRSGDGYFIAMEYVRGLDLRSLAAAAEARGELLPIPLACYIVSKLCEGLDFAHRFKDASGQAMKLVHRDVSPANCLISESGEVKLIDFGIAKAATERGRTATGMVKGKIGYMSPEQVRGQPLDRRSDVFTVGVVLYELLCGRRPFDVTSELETMRNTLNATFKPPRQLNPKVPEELEKIVLRAMATDKGARHAWCSELQDDLQRYLYSTGVPVAARDVARYVASVSGRPVEEDSGPTTAPTRELNARTGDTATTPGLPPDGQRSPVWPLVLAAFITVLCAAGAYGWLTLSEQAEPLPTGQTVEVAPTPPAAVDPSPPPVAAVPEAAVPTPEPAPPTPAEVAPPTTAPAVGPKPAEQPPAAVTKEPARLAPLPPKPSSPGVPAFITVRANREAEVFIDGRKVGLAPQVHKNVGTGRHEVRVDCLYETGRHTGSRRVVELEADDEAEILHECFETKEPR